MFGKCTAQDYFLEYAGQIRSFSRGNVRYRGKIVTIN